jgi:hypothetical protein
MGVLCVILGLFFIGFGFFCMLFPEKAIALREWFWLRNYTPSQNYIAITQLSGFFHLFIGLVAIVYGIYLII